MKALTRYPDIESRILFIRGQRVMLDRDLAMLYEVRAIALRQQVKRNADRFPEDFMFQLSEREARLLVSQNVIPDMKRFGGFLPYVFTEHGVAMLSSVLRSKRAIQVNIAVVRAFVRLRHALWAHRDLAHRFEKLEGRVNLHDTDIRLLVEDVRQLKTRPETPAPSVRGFRA